MRTGIALLCLAQVVAAQDDSCRVHGCLVDLEGAPVAGAELTLHGWPGNAELVRKHGVPADWKDPAPVTSDDDGRFELTCVPPRAFQFVLEVEHADYGRIGWRWHQIAAGAEVDLGETELEPPAVVVGHLVDSEGNLLVEGWRVMVTHAPVRLDPDRTRLRSYARVDPATGSFRVDDLPPGRMRIAPRSDDGTYIEPRWIDARAGVVTELELAYEGPDPVRRIQLTTSARLLHMFGPAPGTVHLVDLDGTRRPFTRLENSTALWEANDLAPGTYTIEIDDPRFRPWRQDNVHTGSQTVAHLVGSASVRLTVRAPGSDAPIDAYGLLIEYPSLPRVFTLAEDGARAPADGLFTGLVPDECSLVVRADGQPPQPVPLSDLKPGETRTLDVTLGAGRVLTGRVVHPGGVPAAGARVQITRGEVAGHDYDREFIQTGSTRADGSQGMTTSRRRDAETTTDAEGRFHFAGLPFETYALRVFVGRWLEVDRVANLERGPRTDVEVVLPPTGSVDLHVELPDGLAPERVTARISPAALGSLDWIRPHDDGVPLDPNGGCRLELLPVGELALQLLIQQELAESEARPRTVDVGTVRVVADEVTPHVVSPASEFRSSLIVRVFAGEDPAARARMELIPIAPGVGGQSGFRARSGELHATGLLPASYRLSLRDPRAGWVWERPEPVVIAPATAHRLDVHVPLVERRLLVLDASGAPLEHTRVTWWPASLEPGGAHSRTDTDGFLTLALPAGPYRVARRTAPEASAELAWEAGGGVVEVVLPEPESLEAGG